MRFTSFGFLGGSGNGSIITSNLELYYDFSNSFCYNGGSAVNDISGNGNGGNLIGSPTFSTANGGIFNFDGSNDYIAIGTVGGYGAQVSVEIWFKTTYTGSTSQALVTANANGDFSLYTENVGSDVVKTNFGGFNDDPFNANCYSTSDVNTGNWFLSTTTYDGSNVRVYINGVLEATYSRTGTLTPGDITVGARTASGGGEYLLGSIAIVRLYTNALTSPQVEQNYNAQKSRFGY